MTLPSLGRYRGRIDRLEGMPRVTSSENSRTNQRLIEHAMTSYIRFSDYLSQIDDRKLYGYTIFISASVFFRNYFLFFSREEYKIFAIHTDNVVKA